MRKMAIFCIVFVLTAIYAVPAVHAQIRINEINWMGDDRSHTNEWIELYNISGSEINLSGWSLNAADDSPTISLKGLLPAGGYFLLERTDDNATTRASADQIYTGSLSNTGETLVLKDSSGSEIDRVSGGTDWENIGGDNETKQTAQYSNGGWITAEPTPGSANKSARDSDDGESKQKTQTTSTSEGSTETTEQRDHESTEGEPRISDEHRAREDQLVISVDGPSDIIAGAAADFMAEVKDGNGTTYHEDVSVAWNMGDGTTKEGKKVEHAFEHAGEYIIYVTAESEEKEKTQRFTIVVEPASVTISDIEPGSDGFIEITNTTSQEVDLSGWSIRVGADSYTFPEHTYILSGATIRYSNSTTDLSPTKYSSVTLYYPNQAERFTYTPESETSIQATHVQTRTPSTRSSAAEPKEVTKNNKREEISTTTPTSTLAAAADFSQSQNGGGMYKWLAALSPRQKKE